MAETGGYVAVDIDSAEIQALMDRADDVVAQAYFDGERAGKRQMRDRVINLIRPCLDRQPDLQKIITALEEMK